MGSASGANEASWRTLTRGGEGGVGGERLSEAEVGVRKIRVHQVK